MRRTRQGPTVPNREEPRGQGGPNPQIILDFPSLVVGGPGLLFLPDRSSLIVRVHSLSDTRTCLYCTKGKDSS